MKDINEIKNRIKNKQTKEVKKSFKGFFIKLFLVVMIFISLTFLVNNNPKVKSIIFSKVYNSNISFAKIKKIYNEKIGNILPFGNWIPESKSLKSNKYPHTLPVILLCNKTSLIPSSESHFKNPFAHIPLLS